MKSYSELERKIGSMITIPSDECDDETRARFNRALGVPDTADEYPKNEIFDDENVRKKDYKANGQKYSSALAPPRCIEKLL